ncbi:helix-turn-helix domain-containing protein [Clostridium perfringens]|uniref:Helix-turn-helix transcriptional regulator n=2 Tax=Clostridium perfringens TaxID=1502 RepID=A0AAP7BX14_CLOPF|nr:helix-turn-helix transcriptional regulator [Clostridium perfringens]EDT23612.1 immunity repressor protein [Clostridium perfringens B str. ATCC 3626]EJT6665586.1 helix-turn-helix transcriptional regulator [Clostridium perfringens]NGU31419.1 helix-turn-helix transcriptional regulator [Clostridium perfringens]WEV05453.1 helix-turn-helix transcriptional regulator [Clostridium perfringens B]
METLGKRIKKYRILKNMTQQQLADKLNKSKSTIQKYESDSVNLNTDTLNILCDVLNIDLFTLLYGEKTEEEFNFERCESLDNKYSVFLDFSDNFILEKIKNMIPSTLEISESELENYYYNLFEELSLKWIYDPNNNLIYLSKTTPDNKRIIELTVSMDLSQFIYFFINTIVSIDSLFKLSNKVYKSPDEIVKNIISKNF